MTMKKILMLVMMVVTMGLIGCGEMTAEEMEKEIVSIAEENGYEMIIIKKNDIEVESATYSVREEVEETPVPTRITTPTPVPTEKVTPTPFPTPTSVPTEESEVTDEVIDYKINPNTGEKIPVYATPTPEPIISAGEVSQTVWKYAKYVTRMQKYPADDNQGMIDDYQIILTLYLEDFNIETTMTVHITAEEYEIAKNYEMARIELAADENGKIAIPMWGPLEILNYEVVTE